MCRSPRGPFGSGAVEACGREEAVGLECLSSVSGSPDSGVSIWRSLFTPSSSALFLMLLETFREW